MFISDTHLPTLLEPWHYTSADWLKAEWEYIFRPAWHCVGMTKDLAKDGDFITVDLLGHPLLIRRSGGEFRAYLNVCAHRLCKLTSASCGHAAEIRCQYHGWEYSDSGATRKIPDAQSFKPLEKGELGLRTFRCETVGQLVFVALTDSAPSLREYLGEHFEPMELHFGAGRSHEFLYERTLKCNWKVLVENSLESYHIEMVHPTTFGKYPPAEMCKHELHERWTAFDSPWVMGRQDAWMHKLVQVPPDARYRHNHLHPNLAYSSVGLYSTVETVLPVTATSCRIVTRSFLNTGANDGWRGRLLKRLVVRPASKFLKRVNDEDAGIVEQVQAGLNAAAHPGLGLISRREERIVHFQRFVRRACDSAALPKLASGPGMTFDHFVSNLVDYSTE